MSEIKFVGDCPVETGQGWYPLIDALKNVLDAMLGADNWKALQIKEKFGALRFYWSFSTNLDSDRCECAQNIVEHIELASEYIDESTGSPGEVLQMDGWLLTVPTSPFWEAAE